VLRDSIKIFLVTLKFIKLTSLQIVHFITLYIGFTFGIDMQKIRTKVTHMHYSDLPYYNGKPYCLQWPKLKQVDLFIKHNIGKMAYVNQINGGS